MYEPKVNLIMTLPGRVMMSEAECLRKVRKPLVNKYGKEVKNSKGEVVWHTELESDPEKTNLHLITIENENGPYEELRVRTRKCRPATKRVMINDEAYKNFISNEVPYSFKIPQGFKTPMIKVGDRVKPKYPSLSMKDQAWMEMSEQERLEWHLKELCRAMGGFLDSYKVLED